MNQSDNEIKLTQKQKEIYSKVKWMCYDVYITTDNQVFDLDFNCRKEQLNGGSKGYRVNGSFRTKKWIRENCINLEKFKENRY